MPRKTQKLPPPLPEWSSRIAREYEASKKTHRGVPAKVTPYREATKISTGTNAPKGSSPAQRVAHHKAGMRTQTDKAGLVPKLRVSAHREKLAHAKNAQALGAKVKKAGHLAKAPSQHALQKGKKGGTFYLSEGGTKVYAKK